MRPLRPATDHRLGRPLPYQLANRPQPPPPAALAGLRSPRLAPSGCYAVLAQVSPGYPPLEGRLATCYSPVRHFTHPDVLLHPSFLVRLACVRHAASVDSEPGSNSHLKLARARTTSNGVRTLMFWSPPRKIREGSASRSLPSEQDLSLSVCVHAVFADLVH